MERAVLNLAMAAVSPTLGKLCQKLSSSYLGGDITPQEIKKLQIFILPKIQTVIKAAEAVPTDELKPWLMDLQAAAFEAEDVLDLYEYKAIENKVTNEKYTISDYKPLQEVIAKLKECFAFMLPKTKLKNSFEKLEQSANDAKELISFIRDIHQITPQQDDKSQPSDNTIRRMSSPIFGRDEECHDLVNILVNEADGMSTCSRTDIPVIAVLGIGGAGKSTYAQAICNDSKVKGRFDRIMWVDVSRDFDLFRITREIIEQGGSICSDTTNLDARQTELEVDLNSNTFLLVLDNIWCENRRDWDKLKRDWDKLLIPLNKVENKGSIILITTRAERVALGLGVENKNLVKLKELKVEDCLSILKHHAFGGASKIVEDGELAVVVEKIADKLKNSPLAAVLIGNSLRGRVDVDAWETVLKEDVLSDTVSYLLLSFWRLPPHLQRCFAFCSLFPKGQTFHTNRIEEWQESFVLFPKRTLHTLTIDEFVLVWIAEGFEAPEDNVLTAVEKGRKYFNELVSYSFFQPHPHAPFTYVIHDLLHDMAEKVSRDHCFRIEAGDVVDIPPTTVHLSIMERPPTFLDASVLANLRTLICMGSQIDISLLDECTKLRVLLFDACMPELPTSIGQLKHLRYLRAKGVRRIPDWFSRLYHLQFLDLSDNKMQQVPRSFSDLVNLQCLLPADLARINIPEIGRLTLLQTLASYRVETSREFGIGQLKNLNRLRGSLEIEGLENVKHKTEATVASLNKKKYLEELSLRWDRWASREGRVDEEEVLEGMEPHSNLKKLQIREYRGAKTPSWT